jgi:hypothetical protein
MWLVKTDANGDSLWSRTFGGWPWYRNANSVEETSDGGYILAGSALVKTDANGDTLWTRTVPTFGPSWSAANAVQQTSDGGYVVAGTSWYYEGATWLWVQKTDMNGDLLWGPVFWDVMGGASAVQQTSDGGYVVAGSMGQYTTNMLLIRMNAGGETIWSVTFGEIEGQASASAVRQTSDGGYALAGYTESFGAGGGDMWLVKLGPDILPAPTGVVLSSANGQLVLRWNTDSNPYYRVYSDVTPDMTSPTFEGSTSDTSIAITDVSAARRFYYVVGSTEP